MIKWILGFFFIVFVLGLALDVFSQVIVLSPSGDVKDIVIMPLPAPTR
jgi:hypothetical protein